ncbi:MAG: class I SAM-dependent methyltransferase [Saccharofermentans sp.]|nr:class I SAM-dependent methyltransferase [Saccharofermentans sp.]
MNEEFYDIIARYYDSMQEGIDHDSWAKMLDSFIKEYCKSEPQGEDGKRLICDLGCGSGTITIKLEQDYGYDLIGIDHSVLMLDEARNLAGEDSTILWLNQDITEYELYGKADVFICTTETVNHITEREALTRIFESFATYLEEGGLFIFDVATKEHFEKTLGDNVFFEDYDDFTLLWDNSYDEETGLSTSDMTIFYSEDGQNYSRADATVYERYYSEDYLKDLAGEYGLSYITRKEEGERVFLVFRRDGE